MHCVYWVIQAVKEMVQFHITADIIPMNYAGSTKLTENLA